ncbi:hypothetical protein VINI7043_05025 [Vibrio nigripulchritudo ATCC 27043]|uniref:Uncharacterized protein n=1 Tax=Vibrio nigripulchritudo SOn1 TaxID=1238450 RepID=A0AAV2VXP6_9VIBR|nr:MULTISPECIES: hypothetical protein [Vibrio]CCO49522.1 conserved exported hypothetical protein [Vibrio nigripulchritudo SOn1]EGU53874.1 hypothetical protein VINI7043_05025 [Vibrio nigripulchritudo ATCC 27043]KJY78804.1 hypothetical protein TW74_12275 [Vibrio nigripulchritudo]UAB72908.1 hypothetical protein INR79_27070 [Vibrio sp. SCSIO 43132]CCN33232.1 conserved exported hypothetical protein [Vibrio nigripulchritudo AM115]
MIRNILLLSASLSFLGSASAASYSQDTNTVKKVFANPNGAIALQLDGGFPNAIRANQCSRNNGWAGLSKSDDVIKSTILTAKASGMKLTVTIEGCEGSWFKIKDLYLQ